MGSGGLMFFITGLPRSRTAWFSAFMTASGHPCLHEGMNNCTSLSEYKKKIRNTSDSNTGLVFIGIPEQRPTLVIHRPERHEGTYDNVDLNDIKGLHVMFDEIDSRIDEIFNYLTGEKIDWNIYNAFKDLNITTTIEMNIEAAKALLNEVSEQA